MKINTETKFLSINKGLRDAHVYEYSNKSEEGIIIVF